MHITSSKSRISNCFYSAK